MKTLTLNDRLPPFSNEAECGVLGCLLLDQQSYDVCVEQGVGPDSFYDIRHQAIFSAVTSMRSEGVPIDLIPLQESLHRNGKLQEVGGLAYLSALMDSTPSSANLSYYLDIVREKATLRRTIAACHAIAARCMEHSGPTGQLSDEVERDILAVRGSREVPVEASMKDVARRVVQNLMDRREGKQVGLLTGFSDLDRILGGLKNGQMIVIAARPGLGKSSLAMNIAENVAGTGSHVGVFSMEMSSDEICERVLASAARLNTKNVEHWSEGDFKRAISGMVKAGSLPIHLDDRPALTVNAIKAKARRWKQKHDIKLLVVDYLTLARVDGKSHDRRVEVDSISMGMKSLAKEIGVPVIVLAQLNRDIEKEKERKPRKSDLRESGQIEQDADVIGLLYEVPEGENTPTKERRRNDAPVVPTNLLIVKQRNGACGEVCFTFFREFTRFEQCQRQPKNTSEIDMNDYK